MNPALLKALTTDYVRDLAEWVTRPLRAVDDARVIDEDEESDGMHCGLCRSPEPGKEETP